MKTASSGAMRSFPYVESRRSRSSATRRLAALGLCAAWLASTGCVIIPVPLPGIKSGRAVNESTAEQITVGTPMADVLIRLGEPDSVSADGRIFAYRFSRTWGAVLWAIGGAGAAQGGAVPVQFGEAVVIEFDESNRVAVAERRAGNWGDPRPDEEPLFYRADFLERLKLGGEPVTGQHRVLWWLGPRPDEPAADRLPIGLPPWTASMTGSLSLTAPGNLFFTDSAAWLRPAFATGTAATDTFRIPRDTIEAVVPFDRGTTHELTLLLTSEGQALALQEPPSSGKREGPSLATWIEAYCAVVGPQSANLPIEGWVVWVSTKNEKGKRRGPLHFSCLWLTNTGLRFENFDIGGKPGGTEFLEWSAIERIDPGTKNRTIIGIQIASANIVCRDGRTLCVAQSAPTTDRTQLHEALRTGFDRGSTP